MSQDKNAAAAKEGIARFTPRWKIEYTGEDYQARVDLANSVVIARMNKGANPSEITEVRQTKDPLQVNRNYQEEPGNIKSTYNDWVRAKNITLIINGHKTNYVKPTELSSDIRDEEKQKTLLTHEFSRITDNKTIINLLTNFHNQVSYLGDAYLIVTAPYINRKNNPVNFQSETEREYIFKNNADGSVDITIHSLIENYSDEDKDKAEEKLDKPLMAIEYRVRLSDNNGKGNIEVVRLAISGIDEKSEQVLNYDYNMYLHTVKNKIPSAKEVAEGILANKRGAWSLFSKPKAKIDPDTGKFLHDLNVYHNIVEDTQQIITEATSIKSQHANESRTNLYQRLYEQTKSLQNKYEEWINTGTPATKTEIARDLNRYIGDAMDMFKEQENKYRILAKQEHGEQTPSETPGMRSP